MLNGWLFGIDASRVKPESRDRLIQYQAECFDVLANYFLQGEAINPRMQYSQNPGDTLTKDQADTLRNMLTDAAALRYPGDGKRQGAFMVRGWSKLKAHFGVSYREIPQTEFTEAVSLVARHVAQGELLDAEPRDMVSKAHALRCFAMASAITGPAQIVAMNQLLDHGEKELRLGRFLVTFNGETPHVEAVPDDAAVMTMPQFLQALTNGSLSARAADLEQLIIAATTRLAQSCAHYEGRAGRQMQPAAHA